MRHELQALRDEVGGGTLEACKKALRALKLAAAEEEARVAWPRRRR